jgi:chitinase
VEVFVAASAQSLPVAVASAPAVAPVGAAVVLDGGASTGGAGGALEYAWRQVSGPAAGLGATNRAVASAHLFSPGAYEFELTVTDAAGVGVPTRVRVEGRLDGRAIPVARIVAPASAHRGQSVRLDGRSSTGGTRFRWTQTGGPWVLLDQASTASFRPRAPGNYVFELEVDDGQVRSAPARVSVLVTGVDTEEE